MAHERREQVEETVLATEDHRRLEDRPVEARCRRSPPRPRPCCAGSGSVRPGSALSALMCTSAAHAGGAARGDDRLRELDVRARERRSGRDSFRMPTRLTTAAASAARRASARGSWMSASTTSTVGSRIRCCARSRRRVGTTTSLAGRDEPRRRRGGRRSRCRRARGPLRCAIVTAPSTASAATVSASRRRLPRGGTMPSRVRQRHVGLVERLRVEHRVGEHFLHVVAGFVERNRLDPDRAFERRAGAPGLRAARARIIRSGRERRHAARGGPAST